MAAEHIAFDAECSPALFEQAALMFRDYRFRRYGLLLIAACIVNGVGFGFLLWLGGRPSDPAFPFLVFLVVGGPLWLLYQHFVFPDRLAARLKRLLGQPMRASVGKEFVCFVLREREVSIPWSRVQRVLEGQSVFLLVLSPLTFIFLPKSGLPIEAYAIVHPRSKYRYA